MKDRLENFKNNYAKDYTTTINGCWMCNNEEYTSYIQRLAWLVDNQPWDILDIETTCGDPDCINPEHMKVVFKKPQV